MIDALNAHDVLYRFATAYSLWRIEEFSRAAYGDDFDTVDEDRKIYLRGKFDLFYRNPVKLFMALDIPNQLRLATYLVEMVDCCEVR